MPRRQARQRERRIKRLTESFKHIVSDIGEKLRQSVNNVFNTNNRRFEDNRNEIVRKRTTKKRDIVKQMIEQRELSDFARVSYEHQDYINPDIIHYNNYEALVSEATDTIADLSRAGMGYIPSDYENLGYLKAFAKDFYCPINPDTIHFNMNAVKITDLTVTNLKNRKADFFVFHTEEVKDLRTPYSRVADAMRYMYFLLERILRQKSNRERNRRKHKGHWGVIQLNEPIHTIIDTAFRPILSTKLNLILGSPYWLKRDKAISMGRPELANRIKTVGVLAIIERKSKTTKKEKHFGERWMIYERIKRGKHFKTIK